MSRTVRQATDMWKHVRKLLNAQRDLLTPQAVEAIDAAILEVREVLARKTDPKDIVARMENLEKVAVKHLKPYPHANTRENIEVILVAIAVALAIRTFFLQPFKIPTGSMQPTLFGITHENLEEDFQIPSGLAKFKETLQGVTYVEFRAPVDGSFNRADPPQRLAIFNLRQRIYFEGKAYYIWFPPDYGTMTLESRSGVRTGRVYRKGDLVFKLRVTSGDHLFVDRLTYNFRRPHRGEIIVFATKTIPLIPQDQFYIKRLVALPGERVQIGNDRHLIINGERLDANTYRFENVYGFQGPPRPDHYSGHINQAGGAWAPLFEDANSGFQVAPKRYMAMGDNTLNSLDSRAWGDLPQENVMGRSAFVYWPLNSRFGWSHR